MMTPQHHSQADQTHSAAPSTSQPRHAQQASPVSTAIAHSPRMTAQRRAICAAFGTAAAATEHAAAGAEAPGQEKHQRHEAWHVVQQKQGAVAQLETQIEQIGQNISYETKRYAKNEDGSAELVVGGAENMYAALSGVAILDPLKPLQGTPVSDGPTKRGIYTNKSYISGSTGNHVTRCHAINAKYGGLDRFINLFPQTNTVNDAHSTQAEEAVKAKIIFAKNYNEEKDLKDTDDGYINVVYSYQINYPSFITPINFHQIAIEWDAEFLSGDEKVPRLPTRVIPSVDDELTRSGWGVRPADRKIGDDEVMSEQEQQITESSDWIKVSQRRLDHIMNIFKGVRKAIATVETEDKAGTYAADVTTLKAITAATPAEKQIAQWRATGDQKHVTAADMQAAFDIVDDHFHTVVSCWGKAVDSLFVRNPGARAKLNASLQTKDV